MNKTLGDVALIAIFAYNRPAHLKKTIESLSANTLAKQSKLIIFCDGAKGQDDANVLAVREIAKQTNGFSSVHEQFCQKKLLYAYSRRVGVRTGAGCFKTAAYRLCSTVV